MASYSNDSIKDKIADIKEKVPIEDIMHGELLPFYENDYWSDGLASLNYNNTCKCPLHTEDTASFRIYPNTNTCNCFAGCGGGDSIWLFREFNSRIRGQNIKFKDAVLYLWDKYVDKQDVSRVTFKSKQEETKLSTEVESYSFHCTMMENENLLRQLDTPQEQLEAYAKVDKLYRLVHANQINAKEAEDELKGMYTKIRARRNTK